MMKLECLYLNKAYVYLAILPVAKETKMLLDLLESVVEQISDIVNGPDTTGTIDTTMTEVPGFTGQTMPPISSEVQGTMNMINTSMANLSSELEAIETMSPEELKQYTAETEAKTAILDTQIQGQEAVSNINTSVNESLSKLSESKAESFDPGRFTPFEDGITLSDSNVAHDPSEFTKTSDGLLERDGKFYKEYADGVYHRTNTDGGWL